MKRAVFLDRDGTLLDGWGSIFPGTRTQLLRLKDAGFLLIVVTNQPDIGDGKIKEDVVNRIHSNLGKVLPIDDLFMCAHSQKGKCDCHKPAPGLLLQACGEHNIDLSRSYMVGDRWRDVGAGENAGCITILVGTGYGEPMAARPKLRAADLSHAVDLILESV